MSAVNRMNQRSLMHLMHLMRRGTNRVPAGTALRTFLVLIFLVRVSSMPAAAAERDRKASTPLRLTLPEALARAERVSARLKELRARVTVAEADHRLARAERLPEMSASVGYARFSNVPELSVLEPGAGLRTIFPNLPDNYRAHLDLSVPLYTGGRIEGGRTAAGRMADAARNDVETGTADLTLEVTVAYWDLVVARQREGVLAKAIEAFQAHLTDSRNRLRFGMAARNEVLAVEVERDRAELDRLQAEASVTIAEANLGRLVDLPPGTRIEPGEGVEELEGPARGAQELEALVAEALAGRPERQALMARMAAAEARLRVAGAGRRPQVAAVAGFQYDNPNRNIVPPEARFDESWQVALSVSLELFDGGRTAAEVARAEAEARAARHQLEELERLIRLEVTARYVELETALAAVKVSERSVESAAENLRVAANRFREGLIPSSERLDAETLLLQANLDRAEVLTSVRRARARLDRSLGR